MIKRLVGLSWLWILSAGVTGCFLNIYQSADPVAPGDFVFWGGLGALLTSEWQFDQFVPQVHVRYGLTSRVDIGLGGGVAIHRDLKIISWAITGDLRYQLRTSPEITLGLTPGNFPLFGEVLSGGALYLSQRFGSLTPYGIYRLWLLQREGRFELSHQATLGIEIFNRPRLPAIFEVTWKDGRVMLGFALRF